MSRQRPLHAIRAGSALRLLVVMILVVVFVGVLGAIVGGFVQFRPRPAETVGTGLPERKPLKERYGGALRFCPPDTYALTVCDVAALAADANSRDILDLLDRNWRVEYSRRFSKSNIATTEVEAFVSALPDMNRNEWWDLAPSDQRGLLTALTFKRSVDRTAFLQSVHTETYRVDERLSQKGTTYYSLSTVSNFATARPGERVDDWSFYFPDDKTLVLAVTRRELEDAIERGSVRLQLPPALTEVLSESEAHLAQAVQGLPNPRSPQSPGFFASHLPGCFGQARAWWPRLDKRLAGSVSFAVRGDAIQYQETCAMPDEAEAAQLFEWLIAAPARRIPKVPPRVVDTPALKDASRQIVSTSQFNQTGRVVIANATIDRAVFANAYADAMAVARPGPK
jgi:hypothetical protein